MRALIIAAAAAALVVAPGGGPVSAHDDIEGSTPATRSIIDEPISSVEIDFGETVAENTKLFLTYDPGAGDIVEIGGTTVLTGDATARLDFDELEDEGTYFVQYLAPVPADGHVIAGSISFSLGRPTALDDSDNPDVRTSSPSSRDVFDDPIASAEIQFALEIDPNMTLQLVYDAGNGVDFDELPGTTTIVDERTARVDFDELAERGTYCVTYDGTAVATGDEIVGAISFIYGEPSGLEASRFPWRYFVPIAIAILSVGAWLSYRRAQEIADDGDQDATSEDDDTKVPEPA